MQYTENQQRRKKFLEFILLPGRGEGGGGGEGLLMYDLSRDVPLRKSRPILSRAFYTKFCQKKTGF